MASSNRKTWRLGSFTVVRRIDVNAGESIRETLPPSWAHDWARNPISSRTAQDALQYTSAAARVARVTAGNWQAVRDGLIEAFQRRELVIVVEKGPGVAADSQGGTSAQSSATPRRTAAKEPPPSSSPKKEKTWIEIRLVNQDSKPMKGARYRLKITDGSTREGSLDENGSVRVQNIDPGTCEVSFLDYDKKEWKRI